MSGRTSGTTVLGNIVSKTRHLLQRLGTSNVQTSRTTNRHITFRLPEPAPIASDLIRIGIQPDAAQRLSQLYIGNASRLKQEFENHIEVATHSYIEASSGTNIEKQISLVRSAYAARYAQALEDWAETQILLSGQRVSDILASQSHIVDATNTPSIITERHLKTPFNINATSRLEAAFRSTPYPSRSEKIAFAKETGLEFKQINVWFQNRRNRSRRERDDLSKWPLHSDERSSPSPSSPASSDSLDSLDIQIRDKITSSASGHDVKCIDPFYTKAATHAFPSPYPPSCDYDPFPIVPSKLHLDTVWPRCPTQTSERQKLLPPELDSVLVDLSCLVLNDPHASEIPQTRQGINWDFPPCFPFLIRPPSAPHPSFIPHQGSPHRRSPIGFVKLSRRRSVACRSEARGNTSTRPPDPSQKPTAAGRISKPLDRHVSRSTSILRDKAHPYRRGPSSRHLKVSRFSSSSSPTSVRSETSMLSSPDSPLRTPPQLPINLPCTLKLSTSAFTLGPSPDLDSLCDSPSWSNLVPSQESKICLYLH